ncbi:MAG TPA: bifunctional phosphopantothenoylcysteine decarboxylase/phosphopantothenate--cysteine ligase CoaBC [Candidatus Poseidoniales archaeon]|nr:MAG TPA: bifunctional phosphopantothenoylcysteine decarboxylase/phosphopantothenate--cysteine ligase CoaBC [Candidatus Poseidoniales archaeon]
MKSCNQRRSLDGQYPRNGMSVRDTDVERRGSSLSGKRILVGVTGGIAAVDTVRLLREMRRHGAEMLVIMTESAQRVITPLAVEWASQCEVITDWDGDMKQLEDVDAILVAPATRNTIAAHLHGMQQGPLLMALSAARSRDTHVLMVPSMHADLADDPVTDDIVERLREEGIDVLWGDLEEGKRKTPNHEHVVARFAHGINAAAPNRKSVVVTLGGTYSPIDDVRGIQNTSSGATGYAIADSLYRHGHDVTCVVGKTSVPEPGWLPLCIPAENPSDMLAELKALANDDIQAWVHTAAVLDYIVESPAEGKLASQQGPLHVKLVEGAKHIQELKEKVRGSTRIGFKLETGIKQRDLIHRATAQIEHSEMTAVVANRLEDLEDTTKPRGYLVDKQGSHFVLETQFDLCDALRTIIERGD